MATVTKDFKVKAGLIVEGTNGTINGSDIITEDIITGGTQTNIAVTYNPSTKTLDFVAENGVADSTTDDLDEGTTNKYFTDARAVTAVEAAATTNNVANKIVKRDGDGTIRTGDVHGSMFAVTSGGFSDIGYLGWQGSDVEIASNQGNIVLNSGDGKDVYLESVAAGNEIATRSDIDALTTSDIEEGSNLYFTNQRAIDAVGGSATSANTPNTVVKRDANGSFSAEDITANSVIVDRVDFTNGSGSIDVGSMGMNIYAAAGDVNLGAQQGQVKIGGSQVTTTDNTQTLTNKAIGDALVISYGQYDPFGTSVPSTIAVDQDADLTVSSGNNATIVALGDITLAPGASSGAYVGSTTEANKIATQGYIDNAVSGLNWKEAVNLLATSNIDQSAGNAAFPIDGHAMPSSTYRILLTAQTVATENGIWEYSPVSEVWTRPADADTVDELLGAAVFVMEGNTYNATSWVQNNHYATTFAELTWTQFSGTGNYTAGFGINLVGREFSADTSEMATAQSLTDAVSNLTDYVDGFLNSTDGTTIEYIDDQDAATLLAANGYSDALVAAGDATATPQYLAINYNDVAKQVAATANLPGMGTDQIAYSFLATEYRTAKFIVKLSRGTHTEVSEVLLTLDTANNVAITEYAIVGTNGSLGTISASYEDVSSSVFLTINTSDPTTAQIVGTLIA